MLPACRTEGAGFSLPTFDLGPSDVEGFMEELWELRSTLHDCFARSEPRPHFFNYKQNPQSSRQNSRPSQQIEESFLSCGSKSFRLKFVRCCLYGWPMQ
jgi:hypothetical protein